MLMAHYRHGQRCSRSGYILAQHHVEGAQRGSNESSTLDAHVSSGGSICHMTALSVAAGAGGYAAVVHKLAESVKQSAWRELFSTNMAQVMMARS